MIFLLILLAIAAAIVAYGTAFFIPAIVILVLSVWSNGVLANFRNNPYSAPNWAASVSMFSALGAAILLVLALVVG